MNERIYQQLMRLYPATFREEFGESMLQHFRDQRRDAQNSRRRFANTRFALGIGWDTVFAALRERFSKQPRQEGTRTVMKRVPSFRFLFIAFLLPLMAGVILNTASLPRTFMSMSRFMITKHDRQATYDPYFIQTQFEMLRSDSLLRDVATELGLAKTMAERFGIKVKFEAPDAVEMLRRQIEIRQARNTSLVELRVYSESPSEAAAIANKIPEMYAAKNSNALLIMVDPAARPLRPVRPNVILNLILGLLVSSILAAIASGILRALFSRTTRQPNPANS